MNIKIIENKIVERLTNKFPNLLVQGFPEKPQEFVLLHPIGALLVHYRGGTFSNSNDIFIYYQEKQLEFAITLVTRNLRSNEGSYELLEKINQTLCGYKLDGTTKILPLKESFLSENNGIWQYEITFKVLVPSIEFDESEV